MQDTEKLAADDFRRRVPRFQGDNLNKNLQIIPVIKRVAEGHNATPAQIALAWVLAQGQDIVPIPGTKRVKYLEENQAAGDIHLTEEDVQLFDTLHVYGERYPEVSKRFVQT